MPKHYVPEASLYTSPLRAIVLFLKTTLQISCNMVKYILCFAPRLRKKGCTVCYRVSDPSPPPKKKVS